MLYPTEGQDNRHIEDCPRRTRTMVTLNVSHPKDLESPSTSTYLCCLIDRLQGPGRQSHLFLASLSPPTQIPPILTSVTINLLLHVFELL